MTATKHFGFLSMACLLAVAMLIGCGSDGGDEFDPNAIPPSITGLDRNAADIGDQVVISGLRFGHTKTSSLVSLNGVQFQVQDADWSDTQLTVNVAQGMTSGIVVVEVDGVSSQSGTEAQLFIPTAPAGDPLISAISPDFGREDLDEILILGFNFGDGTGDSGVYFPAPGAGVSQTGGVVLAPVVNVEINGAPVPQWTNSSIKVTVPNLSVSGSVYVMVDGVKSNDVPFTVLPKELSGPPVIFAQDNIPAGIMPAVGGENTAVVVSGENFGSQQGSSSIKINDLPMGVITWSTSEIVALVPTGALSGPIRVTVGSAFADSATFLVENQPFISGLIPSIMRVGQSLTVTGQFFGPEQGTGSLRVGSTTVTVDSWTDTEISVLELPALSYTDGNAVTVMVTANSGQAATATGSVETPLTVYVLTPNPSQGEAGTTDFRLFVTVVGGSGNYRYTLVPNKTFPGISDPPVTTLPMIHRYLPGDVTGPTEFETQIKVKDLTTNDEVIVDGPILSVVPVGQGVITAIEVLEFNNGSIPAPKNELVYRIDPNDSSNYLYHDFTFFGGDVFYGSALSEFDGGAGPITGMTRDLASFMSGSPTARPYGYRYAGSRGSLVRIAGLNLGTSGQIYLNATLADGTGGFPVPLADIVPLSWNSGSIDFYLPQDTLQDLSGKVAVVTPDTSALSSTQLICSPFIRTIDPDAPIPLDGQFSVSAFDLEPPVVSDVTGGDTYFIFMVQADYTDPFTGLAASGPVLMANPMPANPSGPQVLFDMSTIPAATTVEVLNDVATQASFTDGTILSGDWQGFLWTGVISSGSEFTRATSGIFSEAFAIETTGGGGPPPTEFWDVDGVIRDIQFPPQPISGVTVHIESTSGPAYHEITTSAGDGSYSFIDVPGGQTYEVWAEHAAWIFPEPRWVTFDNSPLNADADFININANAPV